MAGFKSFVTLFLVATAGLFGASKAPEAEAEPMMVSAPAGDAPVMRTDGKTAKNSDSKKEKGWFAGWVAHNVGAMKTALDERRAKALAKAEAKAAKKAAKKEAKRAAKALAAQEKVDAKNAAMAEAAATMSSKPVKDMNYIVSALNNSGAAIKTFATRFTISKTKISEIQSPITASTSIQADSTCMSGSEVDNNITMTSDGDGSNTLVGQTADSNAADSASSAGGDNNDNTKNNLAAAADSTARTSEGGNSTTSSTTRRRSVLGGAAHLVAKRTLAGCKKVDAFFADMGNNIRQTANDAKVVFTTNANKTVTIPVTAL